MRKQSLVQSDSTQINEATISFVRNLCSRISQAIEQIDEICTEQLEPKQQESELGYFEGIGLFSYVKANQDELKQKFPAFTDNQIVSILIAQWQKLSNRQKVEFASKLNLNKLAHTKKFKKLSKMGEKLCQSLSSSSSAKDPKQITQMELQKKQTAFKLKECQNKTISIQPQRQVDKFQDLTLHKKANYRTTQISICNKMVVSIGPQSRIVQQQTSQQQSSQIKQHKLKSSQRFEPKLITQEKPSENIEPSNSNEIDISLVPLPSEHSHKSSNNSSSSNPQLNQQLDQNKSQQRQNPLFSESPKSPKSDQFPQQQQIKKQIINYEPQITFGKPINVEDYVENQVINVLSDVKMESYIQPEKQENGQTPVFCETVEQVVGEPDLKIEVHNKQADEQI